MLFLFTTDDAPVCWQENMAWPLFGHLALAGGALNLNDQRATAETQDLLLHAILNTFNPTETCMIRCDVWELLVVVLLPGL